MSSLYDSELYSILPHNIRSSESQAFCYAVDQQVKKLLDRCSMLNLWGNLLEADERLLDYIATELRTQYYDVKLDLDTKRLLIYNTLRWYQKAGTVSAVKDMLYTIFSTGDIEEWFEYGGNPFTFKISTDEVLTMENMTKFVDVIDKVKNARSKIEGFNKSESITNTIYQGSALSIVKCIRIG